MTTATPIQNVARSCRAPYGAPALAQSSLSSGPLMMSFNIPIAVHIIANAGASGQRSI